MSANAPLGSPSMNTGSVEADCTSATQSGDGPSEVISHAAATSFIHIEVLAAIQVIHNMRNTGRRSGAKAERESSESAAAASVLDSGMARCQYRRSRTIWSLSRLIWKRLRKLLPSNT